MLLKVGSLLKFLFAAGRNVSDTVFSAFLESATAYLHGYYVGPSKVEVCCTYSYLRLLLSASVGPQLFCCEAGIDEVVGFE